MTRTHISPMPLDLGEFDALFREFYPRLCLFVSRIIADPASVEDVATDAFVALWERRDTITVAADAKKFLYRAARNAALNLLRDGRVRDRITQQSASDIGELATATPTSMDPDRTLGERELDAAVRAAIAALPSVRRQVYTLRWEQGMRSAEIAELLELSLKTVEMHVTLAHKSLREALAPFRG